MEHHNVLIVDDESNVLNSLKRELRKEPYRVLLATSGPEALDMLQKHPVSVIVSDMRMPVMDGAEFLQKSTEVNADAVKMVLSGHSDFSLVMDAINRGHIWRYLVKPWQADDLKIAINNALEFYTVEKERKRLVQEVTEKNELLADMNNRLEKKVSEQTKEIRSHKSLLERLVKGSRFKDFMCHAAHLSGELLGTQKVGFYVCGEEQIYGPSGKVELSQQSVKDLISKAVESRKIMHSAKYFFFPVCVGSEMFGVLTAQLTQSPSEELLHSLQGYFTIIALGISQRKLQKDAPSLLNNIDALLGDLDNE